MNNALLELFDEYENNAEEVEDKKPGRKKKTPEESVENKSQLQEEKEKKILEKEDDILKNKIMELVPEDIEENSVADFLDDFDKELDLEGLSKVTKQTNKVECSENKFKSQKSKIQKTEQPKKIKLNIKTSKPEEKEKPKIDTKELSFDEFMELAEKEYREKEKQIEAEEKLQQIEEESFEEVFPELTVHEEKESNIKTDSNEENEQLSVEEMIDRSETYFRDEWIEYYEKANRSKKNNIYQNKLKRGLFRINKDHQIEWLPEYNTKGKTSFDLLKEKWQ